MQHFHAVIAKKSSQQQHQKEEVEEGEKKKLAKFTWAQKQKRKLWQWSCKLLIHRIIIPWVHHEHTHTHTLRARERDRETGILLTPTRNVSVVAPLDAFIALFSPHCEANVVGVVASPPLFYPASNRPQQSSPTSLPHQAYLLIVLHL